MAKIYVRVCSACLRVKKFDNWISQSPELINEIREKRIEKRLELCPSCKPK